MWPYAGRWSVWPRRWAVTEPDPLIHKAAEAVADGVPVDWDRASARLTSPQQRALLDSLRDIRRLSTPLAHVTKAAAASAGTPASPVVALIAAIATLQVAVAVVGFFGPADLSPMLSAWQSLLFSVFAAAGFGLVVGGRQDRRGVLLGTFYLVVATSFAQRFIGRIAGSPRPPWASVYLETLAPYLLWRFVQAFPRVERFSLDDRVASAAARLSLAVGGGLLAVNLAAASGSDPVVQRWLDPFLRSRESSNFYWAIISASTLAALVIAPFRARSAAPAERRRVVWFALGIGLGLAPLLAELLLEILAPDVAIKLTPEILAPIVYPLLASIPLTTAYAVMVERVVEVSLAIRRTLQYMLARAAILCVTVAPLIALVRLGIEYRDLTVAQLLTLPAGRILAGIALTGVVLMLSRERLLATIDRAFQRSATSPHKAIALVTEEIRDAADPRELIARVEPLLSQVLGASRSGIFVLQGDSATFQPVGHGWPPLPGGSSLIALVGDEDDAIDLGRDRQGGLSEVVPRADREWIEATSCAVIAPLRGRTGELLGLLTLRARDGGLPFSRLDFAVLRGTAGPIALVLDQLLEGGRRQAGHTDEDAASECAVCGTVLPGAADLCSCGSPMRTAPVPRVLAGKFRLERRLGAGAMGAAYVATDMALEREVVIKALPRRYAGATRQLEAEARAMARVSDSHLASIFGIETWRGAPLLVMEYLAGGTLADRIRRGPVQVPEALTIGCALARGLHSLHENGLLHRDVKPSNIGFSADGSPKLLDFGLVRLFQEDGDSTRLAGTVLYLAPELLAGTPSTPSSDLWSLSMVLYEVIAGRHPFASRIAEDALREVQNGTVPALQAFAPAVPAVVNDLFRILLARDPARRPHSATEVITQLEQALSQLGPNPYPSTT